MSFLSFFRSQVTNTLTRLIGINSEIKIIRSDLERLLIMEQNFTNSDLTDTQYAVLVKNAIHNFGVAFWVKDKYHTLLFANKICDKRILKCLENTDSDNLIKDKLITMRFIEHTMYDNTEIFIDTVKSPVITNKEFTGTIGSAIDITNHIPLEVRKQKRETASIRIPIDASMCSKTFINLLERRQNNSGLNKQRRRNESNVYSDGFKIK